MSALRSDRRDPPATVAKKARTPGRARYKPDHHCAGNEALTRHSLRPLLSEGQATMHSSGKSCRGDAKARLALFEN
jgi:hypothetical protein